MASNSGGVVESRGPAYGAGLETDESIKGSSLVDTTSVVPQRRVPDPCGGGGPIGGAQGSLTYSRVPERDGGGRECTSADGCVVGSYGIGDQCLVADCRISAPGGVE